MVARLTLLANAMEEERSAEVGNSVLIGRAPTSSFVLRSNAVSRWHALIRRAEGPNGMSYQILDLGGQNGTYVDGARIAAPTPLRDYAIVRIGDQRLEFRVFKDLSPSTGETAASVTLLPQRVATLVCDVRETQELAGRLGPEELSTLLAAWFRRIATEVTDSGGVVDSFLGDRVLAYWAHSGVIDTATPEEALVEGASECKAALSAARKILAQADAMPSWPDGTPFRAHLVIHSGLAHLDRGGTSVRPTAEVRGTAVDETLSLGREATIFAPRIVFSSKVAELLPPGECVRPLGEVPLHEGGPLERVYAALGSG